MAVKDVLGRTGEQIAVDHLISHGYRILDRNWRCRLGEIDIVAEQGDRAVFIEVKTRRSTAYGHPLEAVTPEKLARLRRLAGQWLREMGQRRRARIDAIAVVIPTGRRPIVEHRTGVF